MKSQLLASLTVCFLLISSAVVEAENSPPTPVIIGRGGSVTGEAERSAANASRGAMPHNDGVTSAPAAAPPPRVIWPEIHWDAAAQGTCLIIRQREGAATSPVDAFQEMAAYDLSRVMPLCGASQPAPAVPSPAAVAQMIWRDQMRLPQPEPYIAPGKGITGLAAYLEIRGSRTKVESFNVFGYALTITATSTSYDVDWGDGAWSRGVTSAGGPWPNGDVRHVYTKRGTYTVRVMEHWTGTWSVAGGGGGTVAGVLNTEGRIEAFPVEQLQAVRNR